MIFCFSPWQNAFRCCETIVSPPCLKGWICWSAELITFSLFASLTLAQFKWKCIKWTWDWSLAIKLQDLWLFSFFSSPAWAALWLPLCHYPSRLFLKITLELVIISAHDRKNIKITHPADSHWITRRTKRSRGFVFHLTRMDHPGWSRRLWTVQTFLISGGLPAEKSTSALAACQERPFRDQNTM